jgi:hypothetical protein
VGAGGSKQKDNRLPPFVRFAGAVVLLFLVLQVFSPVFRPRATTPADTAEQLADQKRQALIEEAQAAQTCAAEARADGDPPLPEKISITPEHPQRAVYANRCLSGVIDFEGPPGGTVIQTDIRPAVPGKPLAIVFLLPVDQTVIWAFPDGDVHNKGLYPSGQFRLYSTGIVYVGGYFPGSMR